EWTNPQNIHAYQSYRPARNIMTYSILCFSLAGLIFGFATGGFLGRSPHPTNIVSKITQHPVHNTPTPVLIPSPTPENVLLDDPIVTHLTNSEKADGTTSYTFSVQPVYKGTKTPITTTDVTCRLWLTQDTTAEDTALATGNYAALRNVTNLSQPLPLEIAGAMNFTAPSTQVQPCVANGNTTWTYTLSPTLAPGTYYIYALSDWKGRHFPWYASQIQVVAPS
ncbi:MAG: hypothetical protein ACRDHZ_06820, partial [Ktedonobacteraceae bacterium]